MNCICCETLLTNNLDTFGDVGQEMCWECWSGLLQDRICRVFALPQDIWGLGLTTAVCTEADAAKSNSVRLLNESVPHDTP
jgi:hypothetical protein